MIALTTCTGVINAKPVGSNTAQAVAKDYYSHNSQKAINAITLAYTETSATGSADYYIFNVNDKDGFVIVSAEDAASPVIGYATRGHYSTSNVSPEFAYWMTHYKKQIENLRQKNIQATAQIKAEWAGHINYSKRPLKGKSSAGPLIQSTWDQQYPPFPYNYFCPPTTTGSTSSGQSVTGCVATAMAQIMRYWEYPPIGKGSSSYCDCTAGGFSENYGTLKANYAHPYPWATMALSPPGTSSPDTNIARVMTDAGISVQMDYAPTGSGAWVIKLDDSICAQTSYVKYFGYDSATIAGYDRTTFPDSVWIPMIQNEINSNRPVQYAGFGPAGGHTWVCDGYDTTGSMFAMNWGWSGQDNGFFNLNSLNPGGDTFDSGEEALIGIEPPIVIAKFTGFPLTGCAGTVVNFTDMSQSPTPVTAWKWSFPGGTPATSTSQNPSITYNTPGMYSVTETVTSSTGTDSVVQASFVNIETAAALPFAQGFETGFPPTNWAIYNPNGHPHSWSLYTGAGGYGKSTHSMYYNNCVDGVMGQYDDIHTPLYDFTGNSYPYMYFDVAYTPFDNTYSDTLAIYSSTDCGNTWNMVYLKGGMKLSTVGIPAADSGVNEVGGCFVPLTTNWRTDSILLPSLANKPSVMFSFENRSGYGSNMYLDNINIPATALAVNNISTPAPSVTLYPNPNNGSFTIDMKNIQGEQNLVVYNVLGQSVYTSTLRTASTTINLQQAPGVYFFRILSVNGKTLSEGKLIIK